MDVEFPGGERACRQSGFTLIEIIVVSVVLVAMLGAMVSTAGAVQTSVSTNEQSAGVEERLRVISERIRHVLRPASLSSCKTRATNADIQAAKMKRMLLFQQAKMTGRLATYQEALNYYIPKKDEWIFPVDGVQKRSNLQYRSAPGILSVNIQDLTNTRELEFVIDKKELDNGKDDDGDGLVDEGRLFFYRDGKRIWLAEDLEGVKFTVSGRTITFEVRCARKDSLGRIERMSQTHTVQLRNN